jgi:hypothetical protein
VVPTCTRSGQSLPRRSRGQDRPAAPTGLRPCCRSHGLRCCCGTTLSGNQVRLRLPPQAARTVGPPEGAAAPLNQSREAHHPARPLQSPEGVMHHQVLPKLAPRSGSQGNPSEVRDCHLSKQVPVLRHRRRSSTVRSPKGHSPAGQVTTTRLPEGLPTSPQAPPVQWRGGSSRRTPRCRCARPPATGPSTWRSQSKANPPSPTTMPTPALVARPPTC